MWIVDCGVYNSIGDLNAAVNEFNKVDVERCGKLQTQRNKFELWYAKTYLLPTLNLSQDMEGLLIEAREKAFNLYGRSLEEIDIDLS